MEENNYDYRLKEDKKNGSGYSIRCNRCGRTTLTSFKWFCPHCGTKDSTKFTAEPLLAYAFVKYHIQGTCVIKVPYRKDKPQNEGILLELEKNAEQILSDVDFGELCDMESLVLNINDEEGNDLIKTIRGREGERNGKG